MLEAEEKELLDMLKKRVRDIQIDYEAGRITEEEYQKVGDLLEDTEAKILAISKENRP